MTTESTTACSSVVCCGRKGPQGLQGLQGPAGPQGPQGIQGLQGLCGSQGDVGPMGPQGPVGPSGLQGPAGPQGDAGDVGPQGLQGDVGPKGPQGDVGPQGLQGDVGPQGPQGDVGPQGPQGDAGPQGPQGDVGPEGPVGPAGSVVTVLVPEFGKLTPASVSASSQTGAWAPEGTLTPGSSSAWMSSTDSEQSEWIQFHMSTQVLLTGLFCSFANGRDGLQTRVQVSNDGASWEDVANFNFEDYNVVTPENFRNYSLKLNLNNTYEYVRILSDPCPYLFYSFIQFFGTA